MLERDNSKATKAEAQSSIDNIARKIDVFNGALRKYRKGKGLG